jgi:hypothetical protein
MEQLRGSNLAPESTSSARDGYPAVSRPSSRQPPLKATARIPPGMSVTLILLSSLGLWAAIWAAVSSLLSHWF